MANVNSPYGLLPITSSTGSASNYEMRQVAILYNQAAIYRGDLVSAITGSSNRGYVQQWTNGQKGTDCIGVFWGCEYLSTAQGKRVFSQYWPGADVASTAQNSVVGFVIPAISSSYTQFRIQSDATGVAFNNIWQNADIVVGTGSTTNGASGSVLQASSITTTNTLPLRIMGLYGGPPGQMGYFGVQPSTTNPYGGGGATSGTGAYNWVIVTINVNGVAGTA